MTLYEENNVLFYIQQIFLSMYQMNLISFFLILENKFSTHKNMLNKFLNLNRHDLIFEIINCIYLKVMINKSDKPKINK